MKDEQTENGRLKLICIPYSGSSAKLFDGWDQRLGPNVEVVRYDYPGWGSRLKDNVCQSLDEIVAEVLQLAGSVTPPYAFFGHSMGAVVSYLAAKKINTLRRQRPNHVFLSGFKPPHLYFSTISQSHKLDDSSFIKILLELESVPAGLAKNSRILRLYLPAIRHHFYLLESYDFACEELCLDCKVSVFTGNHDILTKDVDPAEWRKYSAIESRTYSFNGNHFFVESEKGAVINTISSILEANQLL